MHVQIWLEELTSVGIISITKTYKFIAVTQMDTMKNIKFVEKQKIQTSRLLHFFMSNDEIQQITNGVIINKIPSGLINIIHARIVML